MRVCGAKTRNGGTCRQAALENGRCHYHGGKSLAGIASPTFKTGRYSKVLPARLTGRYEEAQSDGELLALRDEVALTDARLSDLLSRVDTGESGALWAALGKAYQDLQDAQYISDPKKRGSVMAALMGEIGALITQGQGDYQAWHEVGAVLEQRRRLVESERKRLVEMQQTLTVEKAMLMIGAIGGIIKAHVADRTILSKISADISALTSHEASE
jgi:hypothetical protein